MFPSGLSTTPIWKTLLQTTPTGTPGTGGPPGTDTPAPGVDALLANSPSLVRVGTFLVAFGLVAVVGWYVAEPAVSRVVASRNRNNPTLREAISRYVKLVFVVVAVFVGTSAAGYTRFLTSSALVVAAVTLVVGVAGQTVIGSLVSGFALVVDPEFNVGDYVEWSDGEGTVRSITLRVTRVQTLDGELVTIPNTVLTDEVIVRPYAQRRYRMVEHVAVDYDDDVTVALRLAVSVAESLDHVLPTPKPSAYLAELGDDAVVLRVQFWVDDPANRDLNEIRSQFNHRVKRRLTAAELTLNPPSKRDLLGSVSVDGRDTAVDGVRERDESALDETERDGNAPDEDTRSSR